MRATEPQRQDIHSYRVAMSRMDLNHLDKQTDHTSAKAMEDELPCTVLAPNKFASRYCQWAVLSQISDLVFGAGMINNTSEY